MDQSLVDQLEDAMVRRKAAREAFRKADAEVNALLAEIQGGDASEEEAADSTNGHVSPAIQEVVDLLKEHGECDAGDLMSLLDNEVTRSAISIRLSTAAKLGVVRRVSPGRYVAA